MESQSKTINNAVISDILVEAKEKMAEKNLLSSSTICRPCRKKNERYNILAACNMNQCITSKVQQNTESRFITDNSVIFNPCSVGCN